MEDFRSVLVDDLQLELDIEDVMELAFKYHCPLEFVGEEDGVCVDYSPLIRTILEAAGALGRHGNDREDYFDGEPESGEDEEENRSSWKRSSKRG